MNTAAWIRSHLLIGATLCYIAGIILSFSGIPVFHVFLGAMTAAPLLLTILFLRQKNGVKNGSLLLLFIFFILTGLYCTNISRTPPMSNTHIRNAIIEEQEYVTVGDIVRCHGFNGRTSKLDVAVKAIRTQTKEFQSAQGLIRYTLEGRLDPGAIPGQTVAIRAELEYPGRFLTPGSFNYPAYLALRDIYVTGFIHSPLYINNVSKTTSFLHTLRYTPETLRARINNYIDTHLNGNQAGIYKALLTGDRSAVTDQVIEHFKGAGVLHILAISGLHMSLLGVFLYAAIYWLLRRSQWLILRINTKKTAMFLCILPLLLYTLIAGAKTPVVRSFIMSLVVIIAICTGRKHTFAPLVSCAALVVLAFSPTDLATPSFQLSFAAVIAIASAIPALRQLSARIIDNTSPRILATICGWTVTAMGVSCAATLGTAPLLIYHFNRVSLIGPLANLIVEPLICLWSLPFGFAAAVCLFIWPPLANIFFYLGGKGIDLAVTAVSTFYSLPFSFTYLPPPSPALIGLFYGCIGILLLNKTLSRRIRTTAGVLLIAVIGSLFIAPQNFIRKFDTESTLTFLDVGHGSCCLLEMPGGKTVLIDGGAMSSMNFDIGQSVIAPFLLQKNIQKINDIVITHADSDHYNGLVHIANHFNVERLWIHNEDSGNRQWQALLENVAETGTSIISASSGEQLAGDNVTGLHILANTFSAHGASSNDNGLIIKYRDDEFAALFPGDISAAIEHDLVTAELDLKADVLLSPHHGSATSNSRKFLKAVNPTVMVVSSGANKAFAFPSTAVVNTCRELGIEVIPTKTAGTISIRTHPPNYCLKTFNASPCHYQLAQSQTD